MEVQNFVASSGIGAWKLSRGHVDQFALRAALFRFSLPTLHYTYYILPRFWRRCLLHHERDLFIWYLILEPFCVISDQHWYSASFIGWCYQFHRSLSFGWRSCLLWVPETSLFYLSSADICQIFILSEHLSKLLIGYVCCHRQWLGVSSSNRVFSWWVLGIFVLVILH